RLCASAPVKTKGWLIGANPFLFPAAWTSGPGTHPDDDIHARKFAVAGHARQAREVHFASRNVAQFARFDVVEVVVILGGGVVEDAAGIDDHFAQQAALAEQL